MSNAESIDLLSQLEAMRAERDARNTERYVAVQERDAALAECERLREYHGPIHVVCDERDAALARVAALEAALRRLDKFISIAVEGLLSYHEEDDMVAECRRRRCEIDAALAAPTAEARDE